MNETLERVFSDRFFYSGFVVLGLLNGLRL